MTRRYVQVVLVASGLLLAFGLGRFSRRGGTTEVVKEVIKEVEKKQEAAHQEAKATVEIAEKKHVRRVRRPVELPSGKVAYETTSETIAEAMAKGEAARVEVKWKVEERWTEKEVVREIRPRWHAQALIGFDIDRRAHMGLAASFRILGPITAGVWALPSDKTGGVTLGFSF